MSEFLQPACESLRHQLKKLQSPILIGVAGDSGSGKTTFSNGICRLIGNDLVQTICTDGYHKEDREQRQKSGRLPLAPEANHLNLLDEHLKALKQGHSIDLPIYNHSTGKFDTPKTFTPTPIVIVEGLHALYPELSDTLDFRIFVDPDHTVKWAWKWERDVKRRGHKAETLESEMLQRMTAYKRWIDFQKINANVVIKIFPSQIHSWARQKFQGSLPENCYRIELIIDPSDFPLPSLPLPFDLAAISSEHHAPFLLAAIPSQYWGRRVTVIHLDGVMSAQTVASLENHIVEYTGIPVDDVVPKEEFELSSATRFSQLLLTWRFLEAVNYYLQSP